MGGGFNSSCCAGDEEDTWVFPVMQLASAGVKQDEHITAALIRYSATMFLSAAGWSWLIAVQNFEWHARQEGWYIPHIPIV